MIKLADPMVHLAEVPDLAGRAREHVPPHVRYACVHWAAHLATMEKSVELGRPQDVGVVGDVGIPWPAGRREGGAGVGARLAGGAHLSFYHARVRRSLGTDRRPRQRRGPTWVVLDEGRQLVIDHYAEIEHGR